MTPKQRWRAVAAHEPVDRLPTDYWATSEMTARLKRELEIVDDDALWRKLGIDKGHHIGPELRDPLAAERDGADVWGVKRRWISYGDGLGSYDEPGFCPLADLSSVAELERYPWPDPDWWDHATVGLQAIEAAEWPVFGGSFEPFYNYCYMRGIERAMEDLADDPAFVECALEHIYRVNYTLIERTLKAADGGVDFVYIAEDLGSQESLLFSPATIRKFLLPRMKSMIAMVHSFGAYAFHHDDGAIRAIIPDLLEAGIDILNPVQWRCKGMERAGLAKDFGARVAFHGAMDNQQTLPFGSEADVRREVRENAAIFGSRGGYILAPCHNIQPITPVANILAMYDEAAKV